MNKTPDSHSDSDHVSERSSPSSTIPSALQEYEASLRSAVMTSRENDEVRAQRRRERRRKNNLMWSAGLAVVGILLVSTIWGAVARRSSTKRPVVESTSAPVLTTVPFGVRPSEDGKRFVLSTTTQSYKVVGKSEEGEPELSAAGGMSVAGELKTGEMLEICAGQECSQQRLSDGNEEPEIVDVETEIDEPYALCAREVGTGEVRRLAQFRVLVKVNAAAEGSALEEEPAEMEEAVLQE